MQERMTEEKISEIMLPQINEIIQQWDDAGIIIETQFQFASQHMIKKYAEEVYNVIVSHGGHAICDPDEEGALPAAIADEVPNEGWMYAIFDPDMFTLTEARAAIKEYSMRR